MRTRIFLRLLAAFLAFTLIAAACGDDDTTTSDVDPADTAPADTSAPPTTAPSEMEDMEDMEHEEGDHQEGDHEEEEHPDEMEGEHAHDGVIDVTGSVVPTVALEVFADPAGGVNVQVTSTDFAVTPEAASTEPVDGQGHYHLYVDGEKVLRFYNDWIYYSGVVEGDVEIGVELSANDHSSLAVDGEIIQASVTFAVPAHVHEEHAHGDPEPLEFVGDAPALAVEVETDPKSGWNAFVTVDGMVLSAEHASGDHVDGEGHLHIYANGQKLGRLYGGATHIPALPDGEVEITVAAYANDHRPYVVDGVAVEASATVTVAS